MKKVFLGMLVIVLSFLFITCGEKGGTYTITNGNTNGSMRAFVYEKGNSNIIFDDNNGFVLTPKQSKTWAFTENVEIRYFVQIYSSSNATIPGYLGAASLDTGVYISISGGDKKSITITDADIPTRAINRMIISSEKSEQFDREVELNSN